MANRVYSQDGISPTIRTFQGGGLEPKFVEIKVRCLNSKGGRNGIDGLQPSLQDRVFDPNGCCFAITTGYNPSIIETKIVGQRGRDPENPSDRTAGNKNLEQRLEPCSGDWCNTITTVQKDNLLIEQEEYVEIRQATKEGKIPCIVGGVADLNYPSSKTRRGRVIDSGMIAPTLTTEAIPNVIEGDMWEVDGEWYRIRIRKLTPLECWRLMDFRDEDFRKAEQVNSNTQLYKQAGNSIVKNCMCEIFKKLF